MSAVTSSLSGFDRERERPTYSLRIVRTRPSVVLPLLRELVVLRIDSPSRDHRHTSREHGRRDR